MPGASGENTKDIHRWSSSWLIKVRRSPLDTWQHCYPPRFAFDLADCFRSFLAMNGALTIQNPKGTGDQLPPGIVGDPYSAELSVTGGSGRYRWELKNSSLLWLQLNEETGILSGTPGAATAGAVPP
jgi:hypothetical protein